MPSKSEIQSRKALVTNIVQKERANAEAKMPISEANLKELFDYLDVNLASGCDHSLRLTRAFLHSQKLDDLSIVQWLNEYGGYCDCEVLANVENKWC